MRALLIFYRSGENGTTMEALIQAFWRIMVLRAGPQSLPAAPALLKLVLLLHFAMGLLHALFVMPFGFAALYAMVSTLTLVAVVHGLLLLFGKQSRTMQSVTALGGGEALLGLMLLPLSLIYYFSGELQGLLGLFSLAVMVWNMVLASHIFRHALSISSGLSFLFSVVYLIIAITLGDMVSAAGVTQ